MTHYVVMDVQDTTVQLVGPGAELGYDDVVPEGKVAVVIGTLGDTVAIIGTPQQLRAQVYEGLTAPIPDGVPLMDPVD